MKILDIFRRLDATDKRDSVSEIAATLAKLDADVATAKATIADTASKRRAALLVDNDDEAVRLEKASADAARAIEKAELVRPDILARLETAKAAARQAMKDDFKIRQMDTAARLFNALQTASKLNSEARELDAEIRGKLGEHSGLSPIAFSGTLLEGGPETWFAYLEREFGRLPPPPSTRPADKPKAVTKPAPTAKPLPKPRPKPALAEAPVSGWRRMVVLKSGYESPQGLALAAGDFVDVPEADAKKAAEAGAADYAEVAA